MPKVTVNDRQIYYQETGSGPETVVFSHGYLMRHDMFADQIAALSSTYRVISFDHRGHGESDRSRDPFGIYDLVDDAAGLIDQICEGPVHFAGMSTGGYVGVRLLLRRPDLIKTMTLIDTSAGAEPPETIKGQKFLLFLVWLFGLRPLVFLVMPKLFGKTTRNDPAKRSVLRKWKTYIGGLDGESIRQFGFAIFARDDVLDDLRAVSEPAPTLIVVGDEDVPTPVNAARQTHDAIVGSKLVIVPESGHSSPVEKPDIVTKAMADFLAQVD